MKFMVDPVLVKEVTAAKVARHFKGIIKGKVERFELPNLNALNFLLHGALGGGGMEVIVSLVEVHPVLSPGMQVGDDLELLTGPRVKGMGDLETSAQTVCISRS